MEQRRVVVTGIGTINPIGNNIEEYFRNLENGVSGSATITAFDATNFKSRIACEVKGFNAYTASNVLTGSGLSSSAAFEVLVGTVINELFFEKKSEIAVLRVRKIYHENKCF